jgi:lipopolysaccharide export LptBFGC system permease protein LptF
MKGTSSSPFKSGFYAFVITFFIILTFFLAQFLSRYEEDLFHKHIDVLILAEVIGATIITLSSDILPISVLVFSFVFFRQIYKAEKISINAKIKKSIVPLTIFCFACFLWISFISPIGSFHQLCLLYDVRMKAPDKPMERTNINLFKDLRTGKNIIEYGRMTDSSYSKINNIKKQTITSILIIADHMEIPEILQDSIALELGFKKSDFINSELKNETNRIDTTYKLKQYLHNLLEDAKINIENEKFNILNNHIETAKMIGFPILVFIVFFLGMFIGILYRNQNYPALLIMGIYMTIFPGISLLKYWFGKCVIDQNLSPFNGQFYFLLSLTTIVIILYIYVTKQLTKEKSIDVNKPSTAT